MLCSSPPSLHAYPPSPLHTPPPHPSHTIALTSAIPYVPPATRLDDRKPPRLGPACHATSLPEPAMYHPPPRWLVPPLQLHAAENRAAILIDNVRTAAAGRVLNTQGGTTPPHPLDTTFCNRRSRTPPPPPPAVPTTLKFPPTCPSPTSKHVDNRHAKRQHAMVRLGGRCRTRSTWSRC